MPSRSVQRHYFSCNPTLLQTSLSCRRRSRCQSIMQYVLSCTNTFAPADVCFTGVTRHAGAGGKALHAQRDTSTCTNTSKSGNPIEQALSTCMQNNRVQRLKREHGFWKRMTCFRTMGHRRKQCHRTPRQRQPGPRRTILAF